MEIERKWLVKKLPDLSKYKRTSQTRHFVFIADKIEVRIQKIGDKYEFERKQEVGKLAREDIKFEITKQEFELMKLLSKGLIVRDSYTIQVEPEITIKVYHKQFKGLIRVEVEFGSVKEAREYQPLNWFGEEITNTDLGRDKLLIKLSDKNFKSLFNKYYGIQKTTKTSKGR